MHFSLQHLFSVWTLSPSPVDSKTSQSEETRKTCLSGYGWLECVTECWCAAGRGGGPRSLLQTADNVWWSIACEFCCLSPCKSGHCSPLVTSGFCPSGGEWLHSNNGALWRWWGGGVGGIFSSSPDPLLSSLSPCRRSPLWLLKGRPWTGEDEL